MTTSFVGRDSELAAAGRALREHRLVTLTGSGGVGKSRLALRFAEEVRGTYADGVWWADLSHLYDDRLFTATVSDALGLLDHNPRAPIEALSEWPAGTSSSSSTAASASSTPAGSWSPTSSAAPNLTVLATSRQPLAVRDEHRIEVAPLSTGDEEGGSDEAVRLFRERCATDAPDVPLDSPEAAETKPPAPATPTGACSATRTAAPRNSRRSATSGSSRPGRRPATTRTTRRTTAP
ncbi:hypothetical protein ACFVEN_22220 [Streptomyces sp. NPDC057681]|uniref:hypothetical protein n=1 Tax=Streptomyces sp. NPDC057681 TaxID=3346209 RepID=UPI0036AF51F3